MTFSARMRYLAGFLTVMVGLGIYLAAPSQAFLFANVSATFPDTVVGQTFPAALGIQNSNTPPESTNFPTMRMAQIDLYPACPSNQIDCNPGPPEAGVYDLAPGPATNGTGTGASIPPGNATCEGTWTIVPDNADPALAVRWRFVPPGGEGTLILATGEVCSVTFNALTRRVPTTDANPGTPGVQTIHATGVTPIPRNAAGQDQAPQARQGLSTSNTIAAALPGLTTNATSTPPQPPPAPPPAPGDFPPIPGTTSDTATLSPPPPPSSGSGAPPTGTITFNLYGPADTNCAGPPVFTNTVPVNGFGSYDTTAPANITAPGTYRWIATYSGDANYTGSSNLCNDPTETVTFRQAAPTLTTQATVNTTFGGSITDIATLAGGFNPTGTITFTVFGPNDATCAGPAVFTNTKPVNGNGQYTSDPFTPTAPGTYRWVAVYSGDANNASATSPCNAPNEQSQVGPANPTIVTTASSPPPGSPIGTAITDTATISNGVNPTGTITFTAFGPDNATCAGAPAFTSTVPVNAGNGSYTSGPFTPTQAGLYRWIAAYSGDANNNPATTACNDPNETSQITRTTPTIVTNATPTAAVGTPITDTATLSNGASPTGTITFTLFGPDNATCAGAPVFTSTVPVNAGNGNYTSGPFTPTAPGAYRWIAAYSGDANNNPVTTACNDPNETTQVSRAQPAIVTNATASAPVGGQIIDVATLSNGQNPTGTITFTLFGPNNPNCTGPAVFTSTVPVNGNGDYTSAPYTPTSPGLYNWVAVYSGDANNLPATSPCGAVGETSNVTQAQPQIVTQASGPVTLGQPISDVATLSAGQNPTGTITFTLFGPNNPNCAGPPIFTSTVPVNGNGNYTSGSFTPTTPGAYNWVAVYSGDANNLTATSPCGAPNETSTVTPLPTIDVQKTANPTSRPEPGGDFTYTVVVTNTSAEVLTITGLTDNVYGNLVTRPGSTCNTALGTVLNPSGNYTCQFTAPFTGNAGASLTDIVTVTATNPNGVTVTDQDDATVTLTPLAPTVSVDKSAAPLSRPEPGGTFTFTVVVTNTSPGESVTITSLTDDIYGNLATRPGSTCGALIGTTLAPGASSPPCTFTGDFFGNAGASQTDVVTVVVTDDDGQTATDTDDATVTITDVLPTITLQKTANPLTRPEPGGTFTFTVVVTNTSSEPVTLTSLTDNVYGNLNGRGTCAIGAVLAPNGGTYTCTFDGTFFGNAGAVQTDVVTATAVDDDGDTATASDDATVSILNVLPQILVTKDATPPSLPEPGGTFTFSVVVVNNSVEPLTITALTDDIYGNLNGRGTCATGAVLPPGGSYSCSFPGTFLGNAGASQTDVVTATGVDDEGNPVSDTDDATVTITNVLPTIAITKTPSPVSRPEPGGDFTYTLVVTNTSNENVTITSLTDSVYGNLTTRPNSTCTNAIGQVLVPNGTYTCQFTAPFTGDGGASLRDVATVTAVDDDGSTVTASDDAVVFITDVLPVIDVRKSASPTSRPEPGGSFTFTVVVTNIHFEPLRITSLTDDIYGNLNGRGTCAIGAVLQPGASYTCSFTGTFLGNAGATQTDVVTVTAVDNEGNTATATDTATVTITNVPPTVDLTKTANPTSRPEPGGTFDFTLVVTNTSNEAVTITSLVDDVYGNLNGQGTCAIGAVLQPGASYRCTFPGTFMGEGGARQTDTITVIVTDDEGSTATDTATATVTITNVPPTVKVTKRGDPTSQPSPGGTFTFTITVTNTSFEPVTITSLVDDIYGNLDGRGTCRLGAVLPPGGTYTCAFPGEFRGGPGASQTDTVTVIVTDNEGSTATDSARATVSLFLPPVIPVAQQPIARTGFSGPVRLATVLVLVGVLMVAGTWQSQHAVLAGGAAGFALWGHAWRHRPQPPDVPQIAPSEGMGLGLGGEGRRGRGPGASPRSAWMRTFGAPED